MCQTTLTKITGQLVRVIPFLPCVGPEDGTQGVGLGSRHLYQLIHFNMTFLKVSDQEGHQNLSCAFC